MGHFAGAVASLVLTVSVCLGTAAAASLDRPNMIFIMTDQQFGDAMSCRMGRQYIHTPVMDSLAARGMVFTRACSANPLCMPLRNSLFAGRYPESEAAAAADPLANARNRLLRNTASCLTLSETNQ